MRSYIILVNVVLIFISHSSITNGTPTTDYNNEINILEILQQYDAKFSISSVWQKIQDSLKKAWDNIVNAANVTVGKIKQWIYELRLKTEEVLEKVKERLNELKQEIKDRLEEFAKQSEEIREIVKKCYKKNEEDIENIIHDTLQDIAKCIAKKKNDISIFEKSVINPLNEELFIEDLKSHLDSCEKEENPNECLKGIEKYVYEELFIANTEVLRNEIEAKNLLDDILDKLVKCTTDGVMKASEKLSKKVVDIGKCIKQEIKDKENENHMYLITN